MKLPRKTDIVPSVCNDDKNDKFNCSEYDGYVKLNLTGVYLNNNKEFPIRLINESIWSQPPWYYGRSWSKISSWKNIRIASNGRQIYVFYLDERLSRLFPTSKHQHLKQVMRTGSVLTTKSEGKNSRKNDSAIQGDKEFKEGTSIKVHAVLNFISR